MVKSMKALITGATGFVGYYLKAELERQGIKTVGVDLQDADFVADLLDFDGIGQLIQEVKPSYIFHLAGQSSVSASWCNPQKTIDINVNGLLNLLDAVRSAKLQTRVVVVGSSDEYGRVASQDCPIKETQELKAANPYAVSKIAQEQMALLYGIAYDMDIIATRSFNHTGPMQKKGFVIPDFASQVAKMEKDGGRVIRVGNLDAQRDFSDVRDIVKAYCLLALHGKPNEVYNVGAGKAYPIRELLDILISMSEVDISIECDETKLRPVELPLIQSDIRKLKESTGYTPEYDIERTLRDVLNYWRKA